MAEKDLFFVYGTLKRGYGNNVLLQDAEFKGVARTTGRYELTGVGFPYARPDTNGLPVLGELYEVSDDETTRRLDALEGNGYFYTRAQREVVNSDGESVTAWIYEIPQNGGRDLCPIVESWDGHQVFSWSR